MYLQDGTRAHFMQFIERSFPAMRGRFERLYARRYPPGAYRRQLQGMVRTLQGRHGLGPRNRLAEPAGAEPSRGPEQGSFVWSGDR
jgi:hypothetical protein